MGGVGGTRRAITVLSEIERRKAPARREAGRGAGETIAETCDSVDGDLLRQDPEAVVRAVGETELAVVLDGGTGGRRQLALA